MKTLDRELTRFLKSAGADLIGFADLKEIDSESRDGFESAISIAVALDPRIMLEIAEGPTLGYYEEYKRLNALLANLGQSAEGFLQERGFKSKARPVTVDDPVSLTSRLPHKTAATRAGLGWIGKCALLITRKYGSAIRLATVLTDAPLSCGKPVEISSCGSCFECIDLCPAHAITGRDWEAGVPREFLLDAFSCRDTAGRLTLQNFGMKVLICGRCIVACPWTKKYLEKAVDKKVEL